MQANSVKQLVKKHKRATKNLKSLFAPVWHMREREKMLFSLSHMPNWGKEKEKVVSPPEEGDGKEPKLRLPCLLYLGAIVQRWK